METIFTLTDLPDIAAKFWERSAGHNIIAFHGEMGAGKTTFIHALCEARGVTDTVGSPTFSIINEYYFDENGTQRKIFHIDLYRLKDVSEAVLAGVEDCLYSDHICLIEWPEKISAILPGQTLQVFISPIDNNTRKLRIGDN